MTAENEVKLREILEEVGFKDELLFASLREKMMIGAPSFTIDHQMEIRNEVMNFRLHFRLDSTTNKYSFEKFDATYHAPFIIDHRMINGIDTALLEEQMRQVDWKNYWPSRETGKDSSLQEREDKVMSILDSMWKLSDGDSPYGEMIHGLLRAKYWSGSPFFNSPDLDHLRHAYRHTSTFSTGGFPKTTASLAYYELSGKVDHLTEQLQNIGFDLNEEILNALRRDDDAFILNPTLNLSEGIVDYDISCVWQDNDFVVDYYKATLIPHMPIVHGVYNGVNTLALEGRMAETDWHNDLDYHYIDEDEDPRFYSRVEDIQGQLYRLSEDPEGRLIADQLQLKFWVGTGVIGSFIYDSAWDYFDALPKREAIFSPDDDSKAAFNLLCGRASGREVKNDAGDTEWQWQRLQFSSEGGIVTGTKITIPGYSLQDVQDDLAFVPRFHCNSLDPAKALLRGDLLPILLYDDRHFFLEANPENKTILIYDWDMRPVITNFKLDPDWQPPLQKGAELPEKPAEKQQSDIDTTEKEIPKNGQRKRPKI